MQEVARYPNEIVQSSSNQYCGPTYPSLLLPFSRIHVKVGGCSTRPGKSLYILALPAGFPLALSFVDTLSRHTVSLFEKDKNSEQLKECGMALSVCLESLCKVITRLNCPQLLKASLLHLMADVLWTLCVVFPRTSPSNQDGSSELGKGPKLYSFQSEFLQTIRQELMKMYETETSKFSPGRSKSSMSACSFPPHGGIGAGGSGKFSTYFQAVLEFVLAVYKYQHWFHDSDLLPASPSAVPTSSLTVTPPPVARSTSSEATPTSSSAASTVASSASWATPTSSSDVAKKPAKRTRSRKNLSRKESQGDTSSKKKDDWLSTVHVAADLLRKIAREDPGNYLPQIQEASLSSQWKTKPNSRLVVVTGIDVKLGVEVVRKGIQKICNVYGGLYRNGLYLPTEPCREENNAGIGESSESDKDEGNKESKETSGLSQDQNVTAHDSEAAPSPKERLLGYAVLDLCSSTQLAPVTTALLSSPTLKLEDSSIQVCAVGDRLTCGEDELAGNVLIKYLRDQLVERAFLKDSSKKALSEIFNTSMNEEQQVALSKVTNNLHRFLSALTFDTGTTLEELTSNVMKPFANERGLLSLDKFLSWVYKEAEIVVEDVKEDMDGEGLKHVWLGLLASGYDFHLER